MGKYGRNVKLIQAITSAVVYGFRQRTWFASSEMTELGLASAAVRPGSVS
jgi:hypothetical protein